MNEIKLSEIATKIGSGATPTGGSNSYHDFGISLIRSQNVLDFAFSEDGLVFIDDDQARGLQNVEVFQNDILLNITGDSVARCCIVPDSILPARVNQHVSIIRVDSKKADHKFIFYQLQQLKEELLMQAEIGATRRALTKGMIENLDIQLPPLPEQKAIADVLSSLDDKIDLLQRQNKTIEQLAQTLFRQWFIDFKFPIEFKVNNEKNVEFITTEIGELPYGWKLVSFEDITTRITDGSHFSPPSVENGLPMASVKDMNEWGITLETCRHISEDDFKELVRNDCKPLKGDVLIAKDGSYLKHVFTVQDELELVILSSIAILRPNELYDSILLTCYLKLESTKTEMENIVTGAVIPRIVLKDFRKFKIPLPPKELQYWALKQIRPFYEKCWENNHQIRTLETLRDTLLPKLISGEVRVCYESFPMQKDATQVIPAEQYFPWLKNERLVVLETVYRISNLPDAYPIGKTIFQKTGYYTTDEASLKTEFEYVKEKHGPFSKEIPPMLRKLEKEGFVKTQQLGKMQEILLTRKFEEARPKFLPYITQYEEIIQKTVKFFSHYKNTEEIEKACTVLFTARQLKNEFPNGKINEQQVLEYIMTWKPQWQGDKKKESVISIIRDLQDRHELNLG